MARSALDYRDEVIDAALPVRRSSDPDIVIGQPEISYHPPPISGVYEGQPSSLEYIPPSPWNNPKLGPEGWYSGTNEPVSDEPQGRQYPTNRLSPAERGFIKASARALEDTQPDWLRYAVDPTLGSALSDTNLPPRDEYIPTSGRNYVDTESFQRGQRQDLGIYGNPQKTTPGGDVVLYAPREIPNINVEKGTVWPDPGKRAYVDLQQQYGTGSIQDEQALKSFYNNPKYEGDVTPGLDQQLRDSGPSYLRKVSYAGDVLSPYARGNAQLGQPSSVEGVREEMARRFHTMVEAMPPEVKARVDIISGHRDAARQAQVNPSVKNSRHMHGMAMDLGNDPVVLDWIGQNPQYGLGFPLRHMGPKEYNHLEMIDPKTGARMAVTDDHLHEQTGSSTPPPQQQPVPAAGAGAEPARKKPLHPIEIFEDAVKEFPIIHSQGLTAGPGESTEYWPVGEPGTQAKPRPSFIPIDQPGMEIGPDARPLDVLGDVVSHHMVNTDPTIKKHYENFTSSLTDTQKELLQAQYMYYTKNEGETRPYDQWEKNTGLPAYFRGYAFQQWPTDFNKTAYTPQQRYHFDQMLGYLRTGRPQTAQSLQ